MYSDLIRRKSSILTVNIEIVTINCLTIDYFVIFAVLFVFRNVSKFSSSIFPHRN